MPPNDVLAAAFKSLAEKYPLPPGGLVELKRQMTQELYAELDREYDDIVAADPGIEPAVAAAFSIAVYNDRRRGGAPPVERVPNVVSAPHSPRRGARRRGAGRPRAQAARSSAKSGDSGDPDPGESDPAWLYAAEKEYQPLPAVPCRCSSPIGDYSDWPHCFLCGHNFGAVAA
jgi:hypothetical protein